MLNRRTFLRSLLGALGGPLWWPSRASGAVFARYPYLQNAGKNGATIIWSTEEYGTGAVRFSTDRSFARSASSFVRELSPGETEFGSFTYRHKIRLPNLMPDTEYFYAVFFNGQNLTRGDDLSFRTSGSGHFSFMAFGDSGTGREEQFLLAEQMSWHNPALVLHLGDLAYPRGSFDDYLQNYFGVYRDMMKRISFFPCPGNHGYMTKQAFPYLTVHEVPTPEGIPETDAGRYYSFDWSNVHFVALDSNAPLVRAAEGTGPMLEWLENDLGNSRKFWKIVCFHHPPYAGGPNENDPLSGLARNHVLPILERHNVQLVLNGHEHSYQRSYPIRDGQIVPQEEGIVYVTSGGGGAWLYPVHSNPYVAVGQSVHHFLQVQVEGPRLTVRAIAISGEEIDRLILEPPPTVFQEGVVNAASNRPELAPGALVSIYGRNLAAEEKVAPGPSLPVQLSGVSVTANGVPLPLLFVSPNQVNAQLPFDTQGGASLRVETPNGVSLAAISVSEAAPGIFTVVHPNGDLVSDASPVLPGEYLTVYATGLGSVEGTIAVGEPAPSAPLLIVKQPVEVEIGSTRLRPLFAGLAPEMIGVYQVNFQVPAQLDSGQHLLRLRVGPSLSPAALIFLRRAAE